jgi:hypothetical protein
LENELCASLTHCRGFLDGKLYWLGGVVQIPSHASSNLARQELFSSRHPSITPIIITLPLLGRAIFSPNSTTNPIDQYNRSPRLYVLHHLGLLALPLHAEPPLFHPHNSCHPPPPASLFRNPRQHHRRSDSPSRRWKDPGWGRRTWVSNFGAAAGEYDGGQ